MKEQEKKIDILHKLSNEYIKETGNRISWISLSLMRKYVVWLEQKLIDILIITEK